jgi:hypothetical protein
MLNQLFDDFLGFVVLFSLYLDGKSLFHIKLHARKTFMVSSDQFLPKQKQVYGI